MKRAFSLRLGSHVMPQVKVNAQAVSLCKRLTAGTQEPSDASKCGGPRPGIRDLSGWRCKTGCDELRCTTDGRMRPSLCVAQPLNNLHGRRSKLWLTAGALQEQPCCNGRAHSRKLQRARAPIRGAIELQQQAGSTSAGHATSRSARCNTVDCRVLERPLQSVFDLRQQAGSIRVRQTISSRSVTRLLLEELSSFCGFDFCRRHISEAHYISGACQQSLPSSRGEHCVQTEGSLQRAWPPLPASCTAAIITVSLQSLADLPYLQNFVLAEQGLLCICIKFQCSQCFPGCRPWHKCGYLSESNCLCVVVSKAVSIPARYTAQSCACPLDAHRGSRSRPAAGPTASHHMSVGPARPQSRRHKPVAPACVGLDPDPPHNTDLHGRLVYGLYTIQLTALTCMACAMASGWNSVMSRPVMSSQTRMP